MNNMKTALFLLLAAALSGVAFLASGRDLAAADVISCLFAAGLLTWTIDQYAKPVRGYGLARPIRLPVHPLVRQPGVQAGRLAA